MYFVLIMIVITLTIITSVWTLYYHHMSKEELHNFGRNRAKVAIWLAKFNNFWAIGWRLIIPEPILEISRRRKTESTKRIACDDTGIDKNDIREYAGDIEAPEDEETMIEELKLCWVFLAKAGIH